MSASATLTISNPWTTGPSDLKRRHTRGNTAISQTSSRSHSTVPGTALSGKSNGSFEDDFTQHRDDRAMPSNAHPATHNKSHSRAGGATRADMDSTDKSSVPSWFGSLRSFAISASSSSRGAFTPLLPPTGPKSSRSKCKSKSNYSLSSSSSSSGSLGRSRSRGRSSSIYYANALDDPDSEGDCDSDSYQDEPVTSRNGLKENRVRGPRTSWALLDPTLGGILPQSYKVVPGSDPEPELSSPSSTSDSSCESSLPSPASFSNVESLAVSETRRDTDDDDAFEEGYGPVDDSYENDLVSKRPRSKTSSSGSAFSLIKSYVPSLPTFSDSASGSTAAAEKRSSGTGGLWSMRRLSMNLLSNNQYAQLDTSKNANSQERNDKSVEAGQRREDGEEGEDEEEEENTQGYSSYKDDDMLCGQGKADPHKRSRGGSFRKDRSKPAASMSPKVSSPVSPSSTSYFASMLSTASSAVSSKGSKARKTGRTE
ncbi:hypothetical protein BGZ75_000773 [Mortierella antarctica]|nr:hypothetical protein BGZ75_000773 [Mortierella antarctica]